MEALIDHPLDGASIQFYKGKIITQYYIDYNIDTYFVTGCRNQEILEYEIMRKNLFALVICCQQSDVFELYKKEIDKYNIDYPNDIIIKYHIDKIITQDIKDEYKEEVSKLDINNNMRTFEIKQLINRLSELDYHIHGQDNKSGFHIPVNYYKTSYNGIIRILFTHNSKFNKFISK